MVTQAQTLTLKGRFDKDSKTPFRRHGYIDKRLSTPKRFSHKCKGEFVFTSLVVDKYRLLTRHARFDVSQVINLQASKEPFVFNLSKQPKNRRKFQLRQNPWVQQKGDTLEFNAEVS